MKGLILYLIIALLNQQNYTATQGGKAHTNSCQPQGHRVWGAQDGGMAGLEGPQPPSVCSKRCTRGQVEVWILYHGEYTEVH